MNEQKKHLIDNIVRMLIESGLAVQDGKDFYLTDVAVSKLREFSEGRHFLRQLIEHGAVELEKKP